MGLFSKSQNVLKDDEMNVLIFHNQDAIKSLKQSIQEIEHAILKLDGHIKSLRGSFNEFKFRNKEDPEGSEDIKTSKPTDVLRGL